MDFLAKIREALGLDDKATEDQVLKALEGLPNLQEIAETLEIKIEGPDADKFAEAVKARLEAKDEDEKSLEDRAKEEDKTVLSNPELADLKRKADAGERAAEELHEQKFARSFEKALEGGRVDAKDETRERLHKLYKADADATIELLDNAPEVVNTAARGSGKGDDAGEAAAGIDQESHELNERVKKHMTEHKVDDYEKALDAVLAEDRKAFV